MFVFKGREDATSNSFVEDGRLITSRYGPTRAIDDFCVDYLVNTDKLVAVTCDLCKGNKVIQG